MSKKERVQQLVDKIGFHRACEQLNMKSYDVVRLLGVKINNAEVCYNLVFDLYTDSLLPTTYKEFTLYIDDEGILSWSSADVEVYATPYWNTTNTLPIDILLYKDYNEDNIDYEYLSDTIELKPEFTDITEFIQYLKDFTYPETYKRINGLIDRIEEYESNNSNC